MIARVNLPDGAVTENPTEPTREALDRIYISESRHILATPSRLLGDFDTAEAALHDSITAAAERWPRENPGVGCRASRPGICFVVDLDERVRWVGMALVDINDFE